ncbi:DUF3870 domain-containing protein [Aneurinibacillus sp. REN35]|uniref:DUF3870 domain-containing protein n=1 Tax=Aneurinibacillus sp. REN35 TaxID=3237286 RepID=UPI003526EF31
MEKLETVLVTGYSKAPQGTSMYEVYKHAGIVLEVHLETNKVVGVEFTFVAELSKDYFRRLIVGYDISEGIDPLIKRIQDHYFAPSQQAIIVALQSAIQRYWSYVHPTN